MAEPDFEALRARRNAKHDKFCEELAEDLGIPLQSLVSNYDRNACYCACITGGPCEHSWDGPEWRSEDGCAASVTCSRCGCTAMSHDYKVF